MSNLRGPPSRPQPVWEVFLVCNITPLISLEPWLKLNQVCVSSVFLYHLPIHPHMQTHSEDLPNSYWQCYHVLWDDGATDQLSPWDMEPLPSDDDGEGTYKCVKCP